MKSGKIHIADFTVLINWCDIKAWSAKDSLRLIACKKRFKNVSDTDITRYCINMAVYLQQNSAHLKFFVFFGHTMLQWLNVMLLQQLTLLHHQQLWVYHWHWQVRVFEILAEVTEKSKGYITIMQNMGKN